MGRKGSETSIETRKLILTLYKSGKSLRQIGELIKRSSSTVQYVIKKYREHNSLENRPRNLNRRLLGERDVRFILEEVKKDPFISCPKLTSRLKETAGKDCSSRTIQRCLRSCNFASRIARKKPYINKINRQKRLDFANTHIHKDFDFWKNVIFTDESKFSIFGWDGRKKIWRKPGTSLNKENLLPTVKHGGGSVMVWGCFSANGVGNLHFINGIMNAKQYIDILKSNLQSSANKLRLGNKFTFYQDNDPKHKAHDSKLWLLYNCGLVLETPPQSPDINPIENLWSILKRNLRNKNISNIDELKNVLRTEWENIRPDTTRKLVESMPRRLRSVIEQNGYPTKY